MTGHPKWKIPVLGPITAESIRERRATIDNDDGVEDGATPDDFYTNITYKGKFFTRGCRGMLESIQVYCNGDGADTLTIRYSPHPCLGPLGEVSITPTAGWAWQNFDIEKMWNYDSLFIWVYACTANISWAYDTEESFDGHESDDSGVTWVDIAARPFIRAVLTGETPGDISISGTINTIEIPSVASEIATGFVANVANIAFTEICSAEGAGTLLEVSLDFYTSEPPTAGHLLTAVGYRLRIFIDGVDTFLTSNRSLTQSDTATSGRCSIGEFRQDDVEDPSYHHTLMSVRIPLKFRRSISLQAYQSTGGTVHIAGGIVANMLV